MATPPRGRGPSPSTYGCTDLRICVFRSEVNRIQFQSCISIHSLLFSLPTLNLRLGAPLLDWLLLAPSFASDREGSVELKALGWVFVGFLSAQAVWSVLHHPCAYSRLIARDRTELDDVRGQILVKHSNRHTTYAVVSDAFKISIAAAVGFILLLS